MKNANNGILSIITFKKIFRADTVEHSSFVNDILVFLLAAVVTVSIFKWFKVSPIIGYLFAGMLIGPYTFGFVADIETTKLLGDFGVVFLLFTIGLKVPLTRLQTMKRYVFGLGSLQVFLCGAVFATIAYFIGQTIQSSIIIGAALALSSTAVVVQLLSERGEFASKFGRAAFSVLIFQDIAVVLFLVMLTTLSHEGASIGRELGYAALKAGIVLAVIVAAGRVILRPVYRAIAALDNPELFVAMTLLVVLVTSLITDASGLSMELGAFLAGLLLSETEYRHQVEADIQPFYGLLLGLFFATVGMRINLKLLLDNYLLVPGIILGMLMLKTFIIYLMSRLLSMSWVSALRTGLVLAAGGEFAFVMFTPAVQSHLLPSETGQILLVSVALSMAFTPFLDKLGKYIEVKFTEANESVKIKAAAAEVGDLRNHVIVLGFGRVGKMLTKILSDRRTPFVVIDNDMIRVTKGRTKGIPVFYGDARRSHVLRAVGADKAKVVVICINTVQSSLKSALMVRHYFKNADVFVRMRDDKYEQELTQAGVKVIMPENLEPSLQLAASVLRSMGDSKDEVNQTIDDFRKILSRETSHPSIATEEPA